MRSVTLSKLFAWMVAPPPLCPVLSACNITSNSTPRRDTLSIIDKRSFKVVRQLTLRPGKTNAHVEFTRDGRYALVSIMETPGELVVVENAGHMAPMEQPAAVAEALSSWLADVDGRPA